MKNDPLRILIADDDAEQRHVLADFLRTEGHEVILARDGEEAVRMAVVERPDVVVMDVAMPRLDGFSACRWLLRDPSLARTPVLLLTAMLPDRGACRSVTAGGIDFMAKPCDLLELGARIRAYGRRLRLAATSPKSWTTWPPPVPDADGGTEESEKEAGDAIEEVFEEE